MSLVVNVVVMLSGRVWLIRCVREVVHIIAGFKNFNGGGIVLKEWQSGNESEALTELGTGCLVQFVSRTRFLVRRYFQNRIFGGRVESLVLDGSMVTSTGRLVRTVSSVLRSKLV